LTTLFFGALWAGVTPENIFNDPINLIKGVPFSFTLIAILLCHEFSHYIASKKHKVKATLPYFIPAPTAIGTLGAVIIMKSPIITRKALIDIGASGPIVGFVVSVIALIIGLHMSVIVQVPQTAGTGLTVFGDSILTYLLSIIVFGVIPSEFIINIHPIAIAGWIGLFVTFLNLLPIGQLDGGHIAYALGGEKLHKKTTIIVFIVLLLLGLPKVLLLLEKHTTIFGEKLTLFTSEIRFFIDTYLWEGWAIIAAIFFIVFSFRHPPVLHWEAHLDPQRRFIGWLTFFIFIITFIPVPIRIL
jgi:membrane-associated protease RseP (regulator of RpoE activity)